MELDQETPTPSQTSDSSTKIHSLWAGDVGWQRVASPKSTKALQRKKRRQGNQKKYGVKVPRNVAEALQFDKENGNDYWEVAIKKEMDTIMRLEIFQEFEAGKGNVLYFRYGWLIIK